MTTATADETLSRIADARRKLEYLHHQYDRYLREAMLRMTTTASWKLQQQAQRRLATSTRNRPTDDVTGSLTSVDVSLAALRQVSSALHGHWTRVDYRSQRKGVDPCDLPQKVKSGSSSTLVESKNQGRVVDFERQRDVEPRQAFVDFPHVVTALDVYKARQILHKLIQSESHRRALVYQKRYLEMVIGQGDNTMTSSSRPVSGLRRFRVAVVVVCFVFRLKFFTFWTFRRSYVIGLSGSLRNSLQLNE